jgi:uncharacterized protein (TIGR03435 family)
MRLSACFTLLSAAAFGQSAAPAPKFDAADVHVSARANQPVVRGPFFSNARYELRFATMVDLVRTAYGVEPERVYGDPSWLEMDRFDVFAKVPAGSTAQSRRLMLQGLLADRFHLAVHPDNRSTPAFALIASKHPSLKESEGGGEGGACTFNVQGAPQQQPAPGTPIQLPVILYTCHNMTMEAFAAGMLNLAGAAQYFNNTAVVDRTELKGAFDFNFKFTPKVPAGISVTGDQLPLPDVLEKQLGLKLESATVPLPGIVVDSVDRQPVANPPDTAKEFPPLPTEFEVADIKPSAPDPTGGTGILPRPDVKNGRLYVPGITLKNLIQLAWDLNGDEFLIGAPKWLDQDKFDILAKTPAGVALGDMTPSRSGIPVNIDALRPMLRSMITERFQMASHTEERPVNTYILSATKPKLKKADPASRTRWQEGVQPDSNRKNANTALGRLVTCQNVSMAQFADLLPGIASGYIHTTVVDSTGLEGGWDFTFSFSPAGALQLAKPKGEDDLASDPNGAVSLFDAIAKQLGLKLDTQKRPTPVLVIDKIERKPTDN